VAKQNVRGRYRLGVDVGGTHTDLVLEDKKTGSVLIEKIPSSPSNPAFAVLEGLNCLFKRGIYSNEIDFFSHGTTVTTNALLEKKGAMVGLLINQGYRAICEVQTQARDEGNPHDHLFQRPPHITPPSLTQEIPGRVDYSGKEIIPLDLDEVEKAVKSLEKQGVRSFAICYLFSFMCNKHEKITEQIIRDHVPNAKVSLSCEVLPRIREWPRYSTTLINAYLVEVLADYVLELSEGLEARGVNTPRRFLMQSNGGVMPLSANMESETVHTLLSGPAAGVQGTAWLIGQSLSIDNIVTLDMGGTSADIAFIQNGNPLEHQEAIVAERLVAVPALDVSTISAGGGSIASVNAAGFLDVGPQSAGANPGPVCYGLGGVNPTVTDADLVCGYLNPEFFLGGRIKLDLSASELAISKTISEPTGLDLRSSAIGIVRMVNARMADEIRVNAAKKGIDLSGYTLVPFGGAGPVHAAAVAEDLDISRVLVPSKPGAFSAFGLLCADVMHDYIRSDLHPFFELSPDAVENSFMELENRARVDLVREGFSETDFKFQREIDLRYGGQGYELRVPLLSVEPPFSETDFCTLAEEFHQRHEDVHGHAARGAEIELVSYRLRAVVEESKINLSKSSSSDDILDTNCLFRNVIFDENTIIKTMFKPREALRKGERIRGPVIVEQIDSTTLVPPNWSLTVDEFNNLILERY